MWLELEVFMELYTKMLPKNVNPPSVDELVALLYKDNKARFEFKRAAGLQKATRKGLAYWPFKIRAVQGHSEKAVKRAAASDMFNAVMIYAETGADAVKKASLTGTLTGTPVTAGNQVPGVIDHGIGRGDWKSILDAGFIPGGGSKVASGRVHTATLQTNVWKTQTTSQGFVPGRQLRFGLQCVKLSRTLFSPRPRVQVRVQKLDKSCRRLKARLTTSPNPLPQHQQHPSLTMSHRHLAELDPTKIKPPPPAYAGKATVHEEVPKAKVPKAAESPKAKAPKSLPLPPTGPPPQKKAAVAGEPKAVPAAQPPVKILEQKAKTPPGSPSKAKQPPAPPPPKAKAEGGSTEAPRTARKIESYSCKRCCAQVFAGQAECDGCGLVLEPARAQKTKTAERRKEELRKLGLKYDFKGGFLRQLTRDQLLSLGVTDPQDRGSSSPEADLLKRGKERLKRALDFDFGYTSVLDSFIMDTVFIERE
eukprot:s1446_g6.t1